MSSRKTYDTDIITLRRIFAVTPGTNAPIPSGSILATTSHGEAAYVDPYSIPGISQLSTALLSLPSTISTSVAAIGGVSQLLAGSGISLSPTNGIGIVTITATGGGGGSVTTANLTSTVIGLGSAGYISSAIGVAAIPGGLVSTANLVDLVSTSYFTSQLASTIIGLGTAGYLSTIPTSLETLSISTGNVFTSSVVLIDTTIGFGYTGFPNQLIVSSGSLLLNNAFLSGGGGGGSGVSQIVGGTNITISPPGGTGVVTINGAAAPSLIGFVSTANLAGLVSTSYFASQLASTVVGLGTAGYISSAVATIPGGLVSTANLTGLVSTSYFASQLASTVVGLGTVGYISSAVATIPGGLVSTANLANLVSTANLANLVSTANLADLVSTANLANLVSTANLANLISTANLADLVSTANLADLVSTANLTDLVSTANLADLVSTANLANLISTANLADLVSTANLANLVSIDLLSELLSTANLVSTSYLATQLGSTVIGLGTAGYFSTIPELIQTQSISTGTIFTSSVMLIDTTIGFGYTGFPNQLIVSSGTLLLNNNSLSGGGGGSGAVTQIVGGANITISPPGGTGIVTINGTSLPSLGGLVSTANLANFVSTSYLGSQLASTVIGLGTAGYISSAVATIPGGIVSTANLANFVSTSYLATQLGSTVIGLGTAGYVSTSQLTSTTTGTFNYVSSFISTFVRTTPGNYSGEQLYMNYSIPVGPTNYELGLMNLFGGPGTSFTSTISHTTNNDQLLGFETDFSLPSFFGTGLWTVTVFAESDDIGLTMYASLFLKNSNGSLTPISSSSQSPFIVAGTKVPLDLVIDVPYTQILAGQTILVRLYCNNTTNNKNILLTLYFEGGNYSHVHTTLAYAIPQNQITSTVVGLGTAGYLSTIVFGSIVSTANLASLVSSANLASLISTPNLVNLISTANLANIVSTSYLLNGIEFSSLSNETARFNFSSMFVNNTPILFDQYGNLSLSFQTL